MAGAGEPGAHPGEEIVVTEGNRVAAARCCAVLEGVSDEGTIFLPDGQVHYARAVGNHADELCQHDNVAVPSWFSCRISPRLCRTRASSTSADHRRGFQS